MKKGFIILFNILGWIFIVVFFLGLISLPFRIMYGLPHNIIGMVICGLIGLGFRALSRKLKDHKRDVPSPVPFSTDSEPVNNIATPPIPRMKRTQKIKTFFSRDGFSWKIFVKWTSISVGIIALLVGIGLLIAGAVSWWIPDYMCKSYRDNFYLELTKMNDSEKIEAIRSALFEESTPKYYQWDNYKYEFNDSLMHIVEALANKDVALAQLTLACFYDGANFPQKIYERGYQDTGWPFNPNYDPERAAYWYLRGAENGDAKSQYCIARCYWNGWGVVRDSEKARYWYSKSAHQNYGPANLALGDIFNNSLEYIELPGDTEPVVVLDYDSLSETNPRVYVSLDSAKYYWKRAAALGEEAAKKRLEKIY